MVDIDLYPYVIDVSKIEHPYPTLIPFTYSLTIIYNASFNHLGHNYRLQFWINPITHTLRLYLYFLF